MTAKAEPDIPTKCPNCGKGPFIRDPDSGELVCSNCGYVLLEKEEEEAPEFVSDGEGGSRPSGARTSISRPTWA